MAGIDDVLERLVSDAGFRVQLATDPKAALAGYELSADDLSLLATTVSGDEGVESSVERRESKAGFFGLFTQLAEGGGGGGGGGAPSPGEEVGFNPQPDPPAEIHGIGGPDTMPGEDVGIIVDGGGAEQGIIINGQPEVAGGPHVMPAEDAGIIVDGGGAEQGIIINGQPEVAGGPHVMPGEDAGIVIEGGAEEGIILHGQPEMLGGPDTMPGDDVGIIVVGGGAEQVEPEQFEGAFKAAPPNRGS